MKIENKVIDTLRYTHLDDERGIYIGNSIIKTIDFDAIEFTNKVTIEGCIIENFLVHLCWFKEGLNFTNNHVMNYIDYQMGGHNQKTIGIEGNIFFDFVNFFDCQFEDSIEVKNNIFLKGSNLLGNKNEGFHNSFDKGIIEQNNIGNINLDGLGK